MADSPPLANTPGVWHRRIWRLTWPIILANITVPLVGAVDVWVMGRLPDPAYIAAVALGATMFSAVYWLFGFLRMGTTALTAQALGSINLDAINLDATNLDATDLDASRTEIVAIMIRAVGIAAGLGLALVALQVPLTQLVFWIFQPSGNLGSLTAEYYQIRIWGAPGFLIYMVELGVLFGLQRMRDTLFLSIGLNLTNLCLDLLLVLGFGLGVEGVAYGTLISEWGAAAFGFWLMWRALTPFRGAALANLWQRSKLLVLFNINSNLILRTFFVQLPFLTGTQLATGLGDINLAAHAILMQLFFFMTYSLDGFAHTAESLTGYYFGAKDARSLRSASIYCAIWALFLAATTSVTFLLFGSFFIDSFTISPEVRNFAYDFLPWLALAPLLCIWAFLFDGIFIGTTHIAEMRNAMFASAVLWAMLLFLSFDRLEYHAVWLSMNAFMLFRGILLGLAYPKIERATANLN